MKSLLLLLCAVATDASACGTSITTASGTKAPSQICSGELIFNEEFDTFDFQTWNHEKTAAGGGNWEFQIYLNNRSNSFVRDGKLFIKPTLTADKHGERFLSSGTLKLYGGAPADECTNPSDWGCERRGTSVHVLNPITSARIRTVESFSFCFGKVEVRAKLPTGDWLWPAIWLLPRYNEYGSWPASGEIDLSEGRGNKNLTVHDLNIGTELSSSTLHFGPFWPISGWHKAHFEKRLETDQGFNHDFHRFQLEWTADFLKFAIDDEELGRITPPEGGFWDLAEFNSTIGTADNPWKYGTKMAPFDKQFYLILNLAVGGVNGYFPDNADNPGGKPWSNNSPQASTDFWNGRRQWLSSWQLGVDEDSAAMQVDYIKVWAI
ncbi:beta-1,3-glucan-binding protein-like [Zootermopsis nevadensis]|uniref:Beta-1,3-glucan-binding protein n=1 Tax=Zootermopsis nevadensis TaxID=136037 RepID=A0A067RDX6_ZOONE|nr:beta-1,3-glucan-binding protein-like [Zootermopsis nevadensis]KDR21213.1 Beta-1,3-glucan-binding protein [Zootermopsis nevadensis]